MARPPSRLLEGRGVSLRGPPGSVRGRGRGCGALGSSNGVGASGLDCNGLVSLGAGAIGFGAGAVFAGVVTGALIGFAGAVVTAFSAVLAAGAAGCINVGAGIDFTSGCFGVTAAAGLVSAGLFSAVFTATGGVFGAALSTGAAGFFAVSAAPSGEELPSNTATKKSAACPCCFKRAP